MNMMGSGFLTVEQISSAGRDIFYLKFK